MPFADDLKGMYGALRSIALRCFFWLASFMGVGGADAGDVWRTSHLLATASPSQIIMRKNHMVIMEGTGQEN